MYRCLPASLSQGWLLRHLGQREEAYVQFYEALELSRDTQQAALPLHMLARCAVADSCIDLCQLEAAEVMIQPLVALGPQEDPRLLAYTQYLEARLWAARGKYEEARKRYEVCVSALAALQEYWVLQEMRYWIEQLLPGLG